MRYIVVKVHKGEFVYIYEYFDSLDEAVECMNKLNKRCINIEEGTFYSVVAID